MIIDISKNHKLLCPKKEKTQKKRKEKQKANNMIYDASNKV